MSRLIDADLLKERIFAETPEHEKGVVDIFFEAVATMIDEQPTIEERKTGKWLERKVSSENVIDEWQSARCSVCGKYHTTPYMYYFDSFSFCPNCGARMER